MAEKDWRDDLISDLRSIGLIKDCCLGCGRPVDEDCGCPAGTSVSVMTDALSPEAKKKFDALWENEKNNNQSVKSG